MQIAKSRAAVSRHSFPIGQSIEAVRSSSAPVMQMRPCWRDRSLYLLKVYANEILRKKASSFGNFMQMSPPPSQKKKRKLTAVHRRSQSTKEGRNDSFTTSIRPITSVFVAVDVFRSHLARSCFFSFFFRPLAGRPIGK